MYDFHYDKAEFNYEPYPICYIPNIFSDLDYETLCSSYPTLNEFKFREYLGNKFSLSEGNNTSQYYDFLRRTPEWKKFYDKIKTKEFVEEIFSFLVSQNIDLGAKKPRYVKKNNSKDRLRNKLRLRKNIYSSRFEFSILEASGGSVIPHTDAVNKVVTIVLSFITEDEWKNEWGGGTNVLLPKDRKYTYNQLNRQMPFEETEVIKTFPFKPNQGVLFIKTYNSWHSVTPMTGPKDGLRKTVTIVIEKVK